MFGTTLVITEKRMDGDKIEPEQCLMSIDISSSVLALVTLYQESLHHRKNARAKRSQIRIDNCLAIIIIMKKKCKLKLTVKKFAEYQSTKF